MIWILGTTKAQTVGCCILQFALLNFSHVPSKFCPRIYVPDLYSAFTFKVYVPELCSEFILRIYPQNLCSEFIFKVYVPDLHSTFTFCVYSSRSRSYILRWTSSTHLPLLHFYQEYFRAGRGITRYYIQFGLHATGSFAKGGRTKIVTWVM